MDKILIFSMDGHFSRLDLAKSLPKKKKKPQRRLAKQ